MIGRTPAHIRATRPLRHGVIADFEVTEQMLRHFIRRASQGLRSRPHVIVCVPSGVTQVERRAVEEATLAAGARRAFLIEEPLAAAIGAGLPVGEPVGSLLVDIGGGTSEMAVTALGGMVVAHSLRVGGYELDEAIVRLLQDEERLLIGQEPAEVL
jgi:rod shape-determining protein MreB